jgi:NADH dehydrogenase/NADH:ubiquinone oxidoreductase subunit G
MATISIDGKKVEFEENGQTILDVARSADIYIPTLCDHPELPPHGGCRMCLVKVEGMRKFATACTTTAKDEMIVETSTEDLMKLKRNILQLLLIEHPSACLVCDQWDFCNEYRPQSQKAGQITGCQTCPNKQVCELRKVFEYMGIENLDFTPTYRHIDIERDDPFFDRDYNICILCARCVRVCDKIRGTSAITIAKRGHETRVDTALGKSHMDSGCWFCGACIDVCPTGALSPRMMKWHGNPDAEVETTCMLCGTGCQVRFDVKWKRIMASHSGSRESAPNHGHMCVLGRFCIPPLINAPDRLKIPMIKRDGENIPVSWDEAEAEVAKLLKNTPPERIGILGSAQLTSEAGFVLARLARDVVKTANIDFWGSDFPLALLAAGERSKGENKIGTLEQLENVKWILSIGGDFVKTHQVVAKSCYHSIQKGAPLIHFGQAGINLQRWATEYITSSPEDITAFLTDISKEGSIAANQAKRIRSILSEPNGAIIIGSGVLEYPDSVKLLDAIFQLANQGNVLIPTFKFGNEAGLLHVGLNILKGGLDFEGMQEAASKGKLDTLYIIDGTIPTSGFEKVPNIIYQSPYPSDWMNFASIILPSATFVEDTGHIVNMEYKVRQIKQVVPPPREARQDWKIFLEIASKIDSSKMNYESLESILEDLKKGLPIMVSPTQTPQMSQEWNPSYRGAVLSKRIQDLARFIKKLPERDRPMSDESMDELIERVRKEEGLMEVSK